MRRAGGLSAAHEDSIMSMELVNDVLVVDDSAVDRQLASRLIEKQSYLTVAHASDGAQALSVIRQQRPDIVLTDLCMPGMDGLELVRALRKECPGLPVVLMTGHGSDTIAAEALRHGAASYVPKARLAQDLVPTLQSVLGRARAEGKPERLMESLVYCDTGYALANDDELVVSLVEHLQQCLVRIGFCDASLSLQIGTALAAALDNALYHGNLELPSETTRCDSVPIARQRRGERPYCNRRIHVRARFSADEALFVVKDEGPGFDHSAHAGAKRPGSVGDRDRGLTLMHAFMDSVAYNEAGNEVTLIKRRAQV
jgi:CheY-like chemotaxis protein/anti-sigma regulatory factor (Ser/Thr protein kinase)